MWYNVPTEAVSSVWQNRQWRWECEPLQSCMQGYTKAKKRPKVTKEIRQFMMSSKKKNLK